MSKKVFIADDELHIRSVLQLKLELSGFNVKSASSAQAAFDAIPLFGPDLLITDYRMPGELTGLDLIAKTRALPEMKTLPIILLSGSVAVPEALKDKLGDAQDVIVLAKPFSPRDLIKLVRELTGVQA